MSEKYITSEGKKHLLKMGFLGNNTAGNFNYLALGVGGSQGASLKDKNKFVEANGEGYQRAQLTQDTTIEDTEQSLSVSAIFNNTNFSPSEGVEIKEIAIVNQDIKSNNDVYFAIMEVPTIKKQSNVSLKYTIIISIE